MPKTSAEARAGILEAIRNGNLLEYLLSSESYDFIMQLREELRTSRGDRLGRQYSPIRLPGQSQQEEADMDQEQQDTYEDANTDTGGLLNPNTDIDTWLDEVNRQIRERETAYRRDPNYVGDPINVDDVPDEWKNLGSGGWEEFLKKALAFVANQFIPFSGNLVKWLLGKWNFFGKNRGIIAPDSDAYVDPELQGYLSEDFLPGVTIPGSYADQVMHYTFGGLDVGTNEITGSNYDWYSNFMATTGQNPDGSYSSRDLRQGQNPYILDSSGNTTDTNIDARGGYSNNARTYKEGLGGNTWSRSDGSTDGSITGGGAYGYATRLRPRGPANGGGGSLPKQPLPKPTEDDD